MAHNKKDGAGAVPVGLSHFIAQRLSALSEAFAATPLMQLRVSGPEGSVTLVKTASNAAAAQSAAEPDRRHAGRPPHAILTDGEPGRQYDSVCADVVGVFHAAADLPEPGALVESDRVLGHIEALKLRTPVKAGVAGRFIGQIVEDGQPVDFGETLFVIDSGPADAGAAEFVQLPPADAALAEIEPPRL